MALMGLPDMLPLVACVDEGHKRVRSEFPNEPNVFASFIKPLGYHYSMEEAWAILALLNALVHRLRQEAEKYR